MMASRTGTLMILAVLALASFPGTALAASSSYSNGFESTSGWVFWGEGDHFGTIYYAPTYAHSGNQYAWLNASGSGFSTVGRTVNVPYPNPIGRSPVTCTAGFWVLPGYSSAKVHVEVINPANWTYLAYKSYTVSGSYTGPYTWVTAPSWTATRRDVFVRITAEDGVSVDDLKVTCNYYYM
jgi:hypothetical protein